MSRSWKHHPIIKVQDRFFKRLANRAARRIFDIGESEAKRHSFGWAIRDQRSVYYRPRRGPFCHYGDAREWFAK